MAANPTTQIPQTADAFKAWADRECGKWPADLQKLAFNTWRAMVDRQDNAQAQFKASYERWAETQS